MTLIDLQTALLFLDFISSEKVKACDCKLIVLVCLSTEMVLLSNTYLRTISKLISKNT
jgi:hypothetical protein